MSVTIVRRSALISTAPTGDNMVLLIVLPTCFEDVFPEFPFHWPKKKR